MIGKLVVERDKGQVHIVLRSMGPKEAKMMHGFYEMAFNAGERLPEGVKVTFIIGRADREHWRERAVGKWNRETRAGFEHQVFLHFSLELAGELPDGTTGELAAGLPKLLTDGVKQQSKFFGGYEWRKGAADGRSDDSTGDGVLLERGEAEEQRDLPSGSDEGEGAG